MPTETNHQPEVGGVWAVAFPSPRAGFVPVPLGLKETDRRRNLGSVLSALGVGNRTLPGQGGKFLPSTFGGAALDGKRADS